MRPPYPRATGYSHHIWPLTCIATLLACAAAPSNAPDTRQTDSGAASPDGPRDEPNDRELIASGSPSCRPAPARCAEFDEARPPRLSEHTAVYDPRERGMWVFGGTSSVPVDCAPSEVAFLNTLWLYDDPCGRWRKVKSRGPSRRARHMATFGDERMWTFGGRYRAGTGGYYALYYDLWTFDPEEEAWQRMPSGNLRPTARTSGALVYDPSRARLWLMGGNQSEHGSIYLPTNDVWSYSVVEESWQQHNVSVGPSPRFFHAAAIDGVRDRLLVFGGASADAVEDGLGYFSDLWALDLQTLTWQELTPSGSVPDGRFWTQLVHDEKADEYVLFGGHDDGALGHRNDTWRFDPESGEWTSPDSEDTLRTPVTGTCEFPADFVEVDRELPERRHAHTLVWSSACEHALLFGGKTDCGATDDVWRWSSAGWNERSPARHGEVCQRWASDPGDCESLCY